MYDDREYKSLALKYGQFSSWAIWDYNDKADASIINQNIDQLHSRFIFLGLNISRPLTNNLWTNFHGGTHDRKLKYVCNDSKLRGSYMTDIFKGISEAKSNKFKHLLTEKIIRKNVDLFNQEMKDIKINNKTQFIILGSLTSKYFNKYFKQGYKNNIVYHSHYSYYGIKDREWVKGLWKKLKINKNFDLTVKKYKQTGHYSHNNLHKHKKI